MESKLPGRAQLEEDEAQVDLQNTSPLSVVAATVAALQATMGGAMQKMAATLNQSGMSLGE